ncbi:MAG: precorrin-2 dehydrogenase [Clostridia bacterium]|nr:precorrin-2 dehydrogenase [Clostridia bacterium]
MAKTYPIFIKLEGQECLVVGGGKVAERKTKSLLEAGAAVTLVSPRLTAGLWNLVEAGLLAWQQRPYREEDLEGKMLVFAATNDRETNARVARDCRRRGLLVNVSDDEKNSNFFVPAVARRGQLQIAVSTGGQSPALARYLRRRLEKEIGPEWQSFNDFLGEIRQEIKKRFPDDQKQREAVFRLLVQDTELFRFIAAGDKESAKERVQKCLSRLPV